MEITGRELKTFFDANDNGWWLSRWLVADGQRISCPTSIAIVENKDLIVELEGFADGFLCHRIAEGESVTRETAIATIVEPEDLVPLEFALKRIHKGEPYDSDLLMSAVTLCESADRIDNGHLLRCLDYGGSVAAWGARGLYAKTHRDGIGRFTTSGLFSSDRGGWEVYLAANPGGESHPPDHDM